VGIFHIPRPQHLLFRASFESHWHWRTFMSTQWLKVKEYNARILSFKKMFFLIGK
jgi:hypothetical protein